MSKAEIKSLHEDETNIRQLAEFLKHRKVDQKKMLDPFYSSQTELVRESGLKNWQEWMLDNYIPDNAGKTVALEEVTEAIENKYGSSCRPGRGAMRAFQNIYSELFKLKKVRDKNTNRQVWVVEFL